MGEPEKPFACSMPDCGMTFTNEDHLHVHTKKHDMVLQLGLEQKAAFVDLLSSVNWLRFGDLFGETEGFVCAIADEVMMTNNYRKYILKDGTIDICRACRRPADQTPTPTRFIRNCEEVGLFLDLPNDNPFEEGFKRAMETVKHGLPPIDHTPQSTEDLHTPQMVYPVIDQTDSALYTNNQRNITISRSSSDESGAIKEYETTTISKLTNEVTTISRRVEKLDTDRQTDDGHKQKDRNKDLTETSVSYTNNVIKIIKDNFNVESKNVQNNFITYSDSITKDVNLNKDIGIDKLQVPPIMSQKSIDNVVDSLTSEICRNDDVKKSTDTNKSEVIDLDEYTLTITLPTGKKIKMKSVDDNPKTVNNKTKEKLKNAITNKVQTLPVIQNFGTLIPVTLVPQVLNKVPIQPLPINRKELKPQIKRRRVKNADDCVIVDESRGKKKLTDEDKDSRVAASRRYRVRLRETMNHQVSEINRLKENNQRLVAELAAVKQMLTEHMQRCPIACELRIQKQPYIPETT